MPNFSFSNANPEIVANNDIQQHFFVVKGTIITGIEDSEAVYISPINPIDKIKPKRNVKKLGRLLSTSKKTIEWKKTTEDKETRNELYFSSTPQQNPLSISKSGDKALAINTIIKYDFEKESALLKPNSFNIPAIIQNNSSGFFSKKTITTSLTKETDFARPPPNFYPCTINE